ncbi:lysine N(6)-hydroxylase/L-ornithine N(5)-oxygenase family protein [Candidatus Poribacteria bacterium]|nr:lysine N(6)-hydroxylase/L-ornithine N(5)-oxygenase family protein [Candidatus Poribacteria bacterium]MYA58363.1 lysine N(6)-hydroxylase/L-ornithine N(5)-oxygenase family protein [Candidatus Poribacteria bacterium]
MNSPRVGAGLPHPSAISNQQSVEGISGESKAFLLQVSDSRKLRTDNSLAHRNIPITIIGGGIHGVSIAIRLLRDMPAAAKHLAVVDRHPHPLTQWRSKTERQGMTFLRSPAVHHITPDALGIVEYAERHNRTNALAPPYSQPSTQLFWDFCKSALAELREHRVYYQSDVAKLRWDKGAGRFPFRLISTNSEGFRSGCVVLAIGSDDCVYVPPEFVQWQRRYPDQILHASQFSVDCEDKRDDKGNRIVIVGGGLTAGTLAKSLGERGHNVALIARKGLKTEQFDFPPVWLGPKALAEFASEIDFQRRYETIQQNRGEGSITPDIMAALLNTSKVDIYPETRIHNITTEKEGPSTRRLRVETTCSVMTDVSRVILATGYRFDLRRYGFLTELLAQHHIPLVCGLPQLDTDLQLHPIENLFGSGTIAQLQIGPASGNIAGANLAYERLREKISALL